MLARDHNWCCAKTILRKHACDFSTVGESYYQEVPAVGFADVRFGDAKRDAWHRQQGSRVGSGKIYGHGGLFTRVARDYSLRHWRGPAALACRKIPDAP